MRQRYALRLYSSMKLISVRDASLRLLQGLLFMLFIVRAASLQAGENWLPDLTTHFLFQYVVGGVVLAAALLAFGSWRYALFAGAIAAVSLVQLFMATTHVSPQAEAAPRFTIVQFNTLFRNTEHAPLVAWLHGNAARFDIVTLHEATPGLGQALDALKSDYPYRLDETRTDATGIIILSRTPFASEKIQVKAPMPAYMLHVTLRPRGFQYPLSFYAMHAMTPIQGKYQLVRNVELAALAATAAADRTPHIVIEGDWNITPYSPYFRRVERDSALRESRLAPLPLPTWPSWGVPWLTQIPIDHILTDDGLRLISQVTGPALGSDHLPLIDGFREAGVRTRK